MSKVDDKTVLMRTVGPLTTASLQVTDSNDSGLSAGDLAYSALKQVLDKVDDQAALKSIVLPMAEALRTCVEKPAKIARSFFGNRCFPGELRLDAILVRNFGLTTIH